MDGFDHYEVNNYRTGISEFIANGWTAGGDVDGTKPSTRFEDNRHGRMAFNGGGGTHVLTKSGMAGMTSAVLGFATYEFGGIGAFGGGYATMASFNTTDPIDNSRIVVAMNAAGNIAIFDDTTSLTGTPEATSTEIFSPSTWYYCEIVITMGGGTAGTCTVYMDGVEWVSATGIATGSSTFTSFKVYIQDDGYLDDIYLTNSSSEKLDSPRIITLYPDAAGSQANNWSGTYRDVETRGGWDGFACHVDSQYISSSTPGQIESFKYNELPPLNWSVHAVRPCFRMVNTGTGTPTVEITCSTGATQTGISVQNDYNTPDHVESFKDSGGTQSWTTADVNGLEMSVEYE